MSEPTSDLYQAMSTLRAVRRLRPDPIPDDVLRRILQAGAWAPSGGNTQPWRVIVVRDAEKKREIGDLYRPLWGKFAQRYRQADPPATPDPAQAKQARMVAAADHLGEHMGEAPVLLVFCFNPAMMAITDAKLDRPSVVGGGSVYPAVQNVMLACRAENVGCVLTTLLCLDEARMKSLLNIPDDWHTCAVMPIGYPVRGGHGPITRQPVERLAYADQFGAELSLDA